MAEAVLADAPSCAIGEFGRGVIAKVQAAAFLHHGDSHLGITHARAATSQRSSAQLELETITLHRVSLRLTPHARRLIWLSAHAPLFRAHPLPAVFANMWHGSRIGRPRESE
jgi:hypothetical protein